MATDDDGDGDDDDDGDGDGDDDDEGRSQLAPESLRAISKRKTLKLLLTTSTS